MQAAMDNTTISLGRLFARVWQAGCMTEGDRHVLSILCDRQEYLSQEERAVVQRLLHALRRGWIQVSEN
ncbi:MAG: hypothetical protein HC925_00305 [Coleofasciculaceae cyanobacterium SM2_3_26]|nr:hypothetical protein [Coleofasciculaceae cyanobacterium SM2_3_26]